MFKLQSNLAIKDILCNRQHLEWPFFVKPLSSSQENLSMMDVCWTLFMIVIIYLCMIDAIFRSNEMHTCL